MALLRRTYEDQLRDCLDQRNDAHQEASEARAEVVRLRGWTQVLMSEKLELDAEREQMRALAASLLRAYEQSRDVGNKHQPGLVARARAALDG